jgi:hypothetical protein
MCHVLLVTISCIIYKEKYVVVIILTVLYITWAISLLLFESLINLFKAPTA